MLRLDDPIFDKSFRQDKSNQSAGLRWFQLLWILGSSDKEKLNVDLFDKTWSLKGFQIRLRSATQRRIFELANERASWTLI